MKEIDENTDNVVRLTKALHELYTITEKEFVKVSIIELMEKHQAPYAKVVAPHIEREGFIESRPAGTAKEYKWINGKPTSSDAIRIIESCRKGSLVATTKTNLKKVKPIASEIPAKTKDAKPEKKKTTSIHDVSDSVLFAELRRRGYTGKLNHQVELA